MTSKDELTEEVKAKLKQQEEAARKEEERLDRLIDEYFMNGLKEPRLEDDVGLNMSMTSKLPADDFIVSEQDLEEVAIEDAEPEEIIDELVITGVVEEEVDEEEVFLVHDDGQITSEIKETDEHGFVEGMVYPRQTVVEKAIFNKAVKNVYSLIKEYEELVAMINEDSVGTELKYILEDTNKDTKTDVRSFRAQLNSTGFSEYINIPKDDIILEEIESKELRKLVDKHVEEITMNMITGGI